MNYYKVLGVEKNASIQEIKKAFREKAKKSHPDLNREDPNAEDKFNDIATAYAVLSDTEKRRQYDMGVELNTFEMFFTSEEIKEFITMMKAEAKPFREKARDYMISGIFWFALGLGIGIYSYINAINSPEGGPVIIMWGAVVFGIIKAVRGFIAYRKIINYINATEEEMWERL